MQLLQKLLFPLLISGAFFSASAQTQQPISDPLFSDFMKLQSDIDTMFVNFHKKYFHDEAFFNSTKLQSKSEFKDDNTSYSVIVSLQDFKQSQIDVKVEKNILTIKASKNDTNETKGDKSYKKQSYSGSIFQSFRLPDDANTAKMKTEFKDKTLYIRIPKNR